MPWGFSHHFRDLSAGVMLFMDNERGPIHFHRFQLLGKAGLGTETKTKYIYYQKSQYHKH